MMKIAPLQADQVQVWQLALTDLGGRMETLTALLSADERARAARFYFERDRQVYVGTRGVLRLLLGQYVSLPPETLRFSYGPHQKPTLLLETAGEPVAFNVSHSHQLALLAFSRGREVGVDVERIRSDLDFEGLAAQVFSPYEKAAWQAFSGAARVAAFFRCWTRKEALLKAQGFGLIERLDQVSVSLDELRAEVVEMADQPSNAWSLMPLAIGAGYAAALAVADLPPPVFLNCWDWAVHCAD